MENIQKESGKSPDDFWKMAIKKGFIKHGKVVASHAELLTWLKKDVGLGHVRANFMIVYLRLRANDPKITAHTKKWAHDTGYLEYVKPPRKKETTG